MRYSAWAVLRQGLTGHHGWRPLWRDPEPQSAYDYVIVGGGGHGLATAYYLATTFRKARIAVLEKGWLGSGNVGRNTTIIRSNYLLPGNEPFYEFSMKLWEGLEQELNFNAMISQRGIVNLFHTDAQRDAYRRRGNAMLLAGADAELLEREQLRAMIPFLNYDNARFPIKGGLLQRRAGTARHDGVAWGYARGADKAGVDLVQNCEVTGFRIENGRVSGVETTRGYIASGRIGVAVAGSSSRVMAQAGMRLPIESHVLQAFVSEGLKPTIPGVITFGAGHFYVSQSDKGGLVFGGDIDGYNTYAQRGNLPVVEDVIEGGMAVMPMIGRARLLRSWGGLVDMSMDGSPIIDRTPVEGLYLNAGWCYGGFAAVVDSRAEASAFGDYRLIAGATITNTRGRLGLKSIEVTQGNRREWIACGALGVSGGWNPNVHLASHHRGRPVWNDDLQAFLPGPDMPPGMVAVGAAAGQIGFAAAMASGADAAIAALETIGIAAARPSLPRAEDTQATLAPLWHVPGKGRAWIDFQNDVTVKDIRLAHQENMRSVEHLKRWTTLGMATDQGKTANVTALAVMAELTGKTIPETGTTIFRPPYTPVSLSALGGGATNEHFRPRRLAPSHEWAKARGAVFVEVGQWMRAQYFPRTGETHWRQSVDREVLATRRGVGICDVTTLGKVDVQGTDATEFLDRLYCNAMKSLKVGMVRYGLMLREDGFAFDDGACARLGENHYVVTTTTAQAGPAYRHMEFVRQCLWPELDVQLISTTDAWAQFSVAGPHARILLERIVDGFDLSNEAFPFMACSGLTVCGGLRARLFRISFSGELAYEIAVPARYGNALMVYLVEKGEDLGATPYGTEALGVLRIEKGHAAGNELNGQTTAQMLGMGRMVSAKKDSIGAVMSRREGLVAERRMLVGLQPVNPADQVVAGAHLFAEGAEQNTQNDQGWISSACFSPHVGSSIGLGFLESGPSRIGEVIVAANPLQGQSVPLRVVNAQFVDPEGERLRV